MFAVNSKSSRSFWNQAREMICQEIASGHQKSRRLGARSVRFPQTSKCFHAVAFLYSSPFRIIFTASRCQYAVPWRVIIIVLFMESSACPSQSHKDRASIMSIVSSRYDAVTHKFNYFTTRAACSSPEPWFVEHFFSVI